MLAVGTAPAQHADRPASEQYPDRIAAIIERKTYPLLDMLQHSASFKTASASSTLKDKSGAALADALQCKTASCVTAAFKLTDEEIAAGGELLADMYAGNAAFRTQADHVLASGAYGQATGAEALRDAWRADAAGVNRTIAIYGEAAEPPYPQIDSMEMKPNSKAFWPLVRLGVLSIKEQSRPGDPFFLPNVRFAMSLLRASDREDAASFEPMEKGLNAAAIAHAKTIAWSKYAYSAILVPGIGPDIVGQAISPLGRLHVALAAERFRSGKAPFIIVSGGSVHPAHTTFFEAVEMRRELMERYGIPANAILIDPHARHTTTNLRNAVREIASYRFPMEKPLLIVANESQTNAIISPKFADRNRKELGYLPWLTIKRLGPTDIEFTPNKSSMHVDALSPLDP